MAKLLKDKLSFVDRRELASATMPIQSHGLWTRTEVLASHDDVEINKNGKSYFVKKIPIGVSKLGETLFRKEKVKPIMEESNMVPIGGCQFAMELLFGVKATQFSIPTLYSMNGIGLPDSITPTTVYDVPGGTKSIIYNHGNIVQLFGVGITGTAENDVTVHNVDYRENSIEMARVTTDGLTLTGTMIPFRYTSEVLKESEKLKYFGKKSVSTGETAYYLKRFEADPAIKHIWKTGEDIDGETLVSSADVWTNNVGVNAVESFTEFIIKITKEEVKEWFISLGQEDKSRINTIALFTGQYVNNPDTGIGDYRDVRMFSKLNIPTEHLSLTKDVNFIYRVYTA